MNNCGIRPAARGAGGFEAGANLRNPALLNEVRPGDRSAARIRADDRERDQPAYAERRDVPYARQRHGVRHGGASHRAHCHGQKRIIKVGGAYHGWSDQMVYGLKIPGSRALLESHGIPGGCYEATDEVRPNDLTMLEDMLKRNVLLGGTAGVIVEPVGPESGTRPVAHDYNAGVRALCDKYGALMIFDEGRHGLPRRAFGRAGLFRRRAGSDGLRARSSQAGTRRRAASAARRNTRSSWRPVLPRASTGRMSAARWRPIPLSCLAGYTAIREIERTNACEIAGKMGDRLCDGLKGLLDRYGLPFVAYNQGSIVHLECTGAMSF